MQIVQLVFNKIRNQYFSYALFAFVFVLMYTVYAQSMPWKILLVLFTVGVVLLTFKPKKLEYATALIIIVTGVMSAYLSPNNDIPDEPVHYQRSLFLSEGDMNLSNDKNQLLESEDYDKIDKEFRVPLMISQLVGIEPSEKEIPNERLTVTNAYYIFGYLPQAIGLKIGNSLDISVILSYFLGRVFNVFVYALLVFFAIRFAGKMGQVIAVASLIPMNVYLAGSYNQDAFSLGVILLLLGLFCHFYQTEKKIGLWKVLLFIALSALLITLKLPFLLLLGLLIFVPNEKFDSGPVPIWLIKGLAVLFVALLAVFWMRTYSQIINVNFNDVEFLKDVNPKEQLLSILSQPVVYGKVLVGETLMRDLNPANIHLYGWLAYGPTFLISYTILFFFLVVMNNANKIRFNILGRLSLLLIGLALTMGIVLAMYLSWTPVGSQTVLGIQDRYVLGIIPLFLIFLTANTKFFEKFQDFLSEELVLNISICFIYTMLLSTVFTYYNF